MQTTNVDNKTKWVQTFKMTNKYNAGNEQQSSFILDANTSEIQILWQLDKVLYKCFTAMSSEGKPVTAPMIIDKAKSLYDEMKITDKYKSCNGWL